MTELFGLVSKRERGCATTIAPAPSPQKRAGRDEGRQRHARSVTGRCPNEFPALRREAKPRWRSGPGDHSSTPRTSVGSPSPSSGTSPSWTSVSELDRAQTRSSSRSIPSLPGKRADTADRFDGHVRPSIGLKRFSDRLVDSCTAARLDRVVHETSFERDRRFIRRKQTCSVSRSS